MAEKKRIEKEIALVQARIRALPEGKLTVAGNGTHVKRYQSFGDHRICIPKKNKELVHNLTIKQELIILFKNLNDELNEINQYLTHHKERKVKGSYPTVKQYSDWANEPYESNPMNPEQKVHHTVTGITVRAKSKAMITWLLYINNIPFQYERKLELGDYAFYPDFTIRHPKTGELYYWEHFGMMNNTEYCSNALYKMNKYLLFNLKLSVQLITTFESKEKPLNEEDVENVIAKYFK